MGVTRIGGELVQDKTLDRLDLVDNILGGSDWNVTSGAQDATFTHLRDAAASHEPATKGQLDAAVATLESQFGSGLDYKGSLDASDDTAFVAAAHSKGDFYKVSVAGTIAGVAVNVNDNVIINKVVAAGTLVSADIDVIDNTESADLLRESDVVDGLASTDALAPLSANQGRILNDAIAAVDVKIKEEKFGEKPVVTAGQAAVSALANPPISGTLRVYRRGMRMDEGSGNDYTVNYSTGVITFEYNLQTRDIDKIICDYKYV